MDPIDFLQIAGDLRESEREAERRTSIGRSYYALFNVAKEPAPISSRMNQDDADHARVQYYLKRSQQPELMLVAQALSNLRLDRNAADYDMRSLVEAGTAKKAYASAEANCKRFRKFSSTQLEAFIRAVPRYVPKSEKTP